MIQEPVLINQKTLIIGANSAIAKALAVKVADTQNTGLIVISRNIAAYTQSPLANTKHIEVPDYSQSSIEAAVNSIKSCLCVPITRVYICHGILHSHTVKPEKRLEDFDPNTFIEVLTANALTPLLWIKALTDIITSNVECKVTVFSARVGSISDNHLGGWYSYRASKAALNMLLKTVSIEFSRRAKNIKIISFHPGTTDTLLSKPFQKNVPEGKLFTCDFVANQLISIVNDIAIDGELSYVDWQGRNIDW